MIYAQIISQKRSALDAKKYQAKQIAWYRRLKTNDLSGKGFNVPELARLFGLTGQHQQHPELVYLPTLTHISTSLSVREA